MTDALIGAVDLDCLDAVSHLVVQRGSSADRVPLALVDARVSLAQQHWQLAMLLATRRASSIVSCSWGSDKEPS